MLKLSEFVTLFALPSVPELSSASLLLTVCIYIYIYDNLEEKNCDRNWIGVLNYLKKFCPQHTLSCIGQMFL